MINSRNLADLKPEVQQLAQQFVALAAANNRPILITSTYRDAEWQAALYAQGRTHPGPIVTDAKPGESFHQYRVAFDWCLLVDGKPVWNDPQGYAECGALAKTLGLDWAGDWVSFKELDHCQFTNGMTLADLRMEPPPQPQTEPTPG